MAQQGTNGRSEGYQNYRVQTPQAAFPESQTFVGNMATSVATGTGTSAWATVSLAGIVRATAENAHCAFKVRMASQSFVSCNATLEIRRDDQVDSVVFTAADMYTSSGDSLNRMTHFTAPLAMGGVCSFDYRVTGTLSTNAAWSITVLGDHTRKRNVADANESVTGLGDGSNQGPTTESGGAGL